MLFGVGMLVAIPCNLGLVMTLYLEGPMSPVFVPYMTHNATVVSNILCARLIHAAGAQLHLHLGHPRPLLDSLWVTLCNVVNSDSHLLGRQ